MDERFNKIEDKLDKLVEIQTEIKIDVAEHIRRTNLAENNIEKLYDAIQPIQQHVALVRGLGNLTAWSLGILTAIATIYAALK